MLVSLRAVAGICRASEKSVLHTPWAICCTPWGYGAQYNASIQCMPASVLHTCMCRYSTAALGILLQAREAWASLTGA